PEPGVFLDDRGDLRRLKLILARRRFEQETVRARQLIDDRPNKILRDLETPRDLVEVGRSAARLRRQDPIENRARERVTARLNCFKRVEPAVDMLAHDAQQATDLFVLWKIDV